MRNRIVGYGMVSVDAILYHPENFKVHPLEQRQSVDESLNTLGWISTVIINKTTGHLLDGHMRVEEAERNGEAEVPALILELTPEEELEALATFDAIGDMSRMDGVKYMGLMKKLGDVTPALRAMLSAKAEQAGLLVKAEKVREKRDNNRVGETPVESETRFSGDSGEAMGESVSIPSKVPGGLHELTSVLPVECDSAWIDGLTDWAVLSAIKDGGAVLVNVRPNSDVAEAIKGLVIGGCVVLCVTSWQNDIRTIAGYDFGYTLVIHAYKGNKVGRFYGGRRNGELHSHTIVDGIKEFIRNTTPPAAKVLIVNDTNGEGVMACEATGRSAKSLLPNDQIQHTLKRITDANES